MTSRTPRPSPRPSLAATRCAAAVLLTASAMAAQPAWAARLGHSRVVSAQNAPLQVLIPLTDLTPDERASLQVAVAPADAWQRAGLKPPVPLASMTLKVETGADPSQRNVRLTSPDVAADPAVDVLLSVGSGAGQRLVQLTVMQTTQGFPGLNSQATVGPAARAGGAGGSVAVRQGDTLYGIAQSHALADATIYQMLVALWRANPQAFIQNNMNRVKAGARLIVPDASTVRAIDPGEARRIFLEQAEAYARYRAGLAGAAGRGAPAAQGPATSGQVGSGAPAAQPETGAQDRLRLSSGVPGQAGQGTEEAAQSRADAETATAKAAQDAKSRVDELERNVKDLNAALAQQGQGGKGAAGGPGLTVPGLALAGGPGAAVQGGANGGVSGGVNGQARAAGQGGPNGAAGADAQGSAAGQAAPGQPGAGGSTQSGASAGANGQAGAGAQSGSNAQPAAAGQSGVNGQPAAGGSTDGAGAQPGAAGGGQAGAAGQAGAGAQGSAGSANAGAGTNAGTGNAGNAAGTNAGGGAAAGGANSANGAASSASGATGSGGAGSANAPGSAGSSPGSANGAGAGSTAGSPAAGANAPAGAGSPSTAGAAGSTAGADRATGASSANGDSLSAGGKAARPTSALPRWLSDNLLIFMTVVLTLIAFVIAWLLRRAGARRDDEDDDMGEDLYATEIDPAAIDRRLDGIDLDLDSRPNDAPARREPGVGRADPLRS